MRPLVHYGHTYHCRLTPVRHEFKYNLYYFEFDLDSLEETRLPRLLFAYNKFALFSLHDSDYLKNRDKTPLRLKLRSLLKELEVDTPIERVRLFTAPRFLGYAFNPVSFYYCYDCKDALVAIVAEVHNTFDEVHPYVLSVDHSTTQGGFTRFTFKKQFYVSPFYPVSGEYEVLLKDADDALNIHVNLLHEGTKSFVSGLLGQGCEATGRELLRTAVTYPLTAFATLTRIEWQAFLLYVKRRLPFQEKPHSLHRNSYPRSPRRFFALLRERAMKFIARFRFNSESILLNDSNVTRSKQ